VTATAVRDYTHIQVRPLTGSIGAEVAGVDLADVDDDTFAELADAWLDHKVLFFRDQGHLSQAQHIAYGQRWGTLEVHPFTRNDAAHPEIIVLESTPEKFEAAEFWHTDVTFRERPPLGSILRGMVIPPIGGDTLWADMELAYDRLDDATKEQIEGRVATHSMAKVFGRKVSAEEAERRRAEYPDVVHPVVRTHPVTGRRAVFVNKPFTLRIEGLEPEESERLLDRLYDQAKVPQYQCRFRWEPGSVAQWDNRCTQHYAVPDFCGQHRRMERVTIAGDRPV
jgi:taurine dioxygenase